MSLLVCLVESANFRIYWSDFTGAGLGYESKVWSRYERQRRNGLGFLVSKGMDTPSRTTQEREKNLLYPNFHFFSVKTFS